MNIYSEPIETERAIYRYNYLAGCLERLERIRKIQNQHGKNILVQEKTITNRYPITPQAWESCPGYWADLAESKI